jgi:hypothetical protein
LQLQLVNRTFYKKITPDIISCQRNHKHPFNITRDVSISEQAQVRHVSAVQEKNEYNMACGRSPMAWHQLANVQLRTLIEFKLLINLKPEEA